MKIGQAGDGVSIDDLVHRPVGNEAERTAELLPCPFCGGKAKLMEGLHRVDGDVYPLYGVCCLDADDSTYGVEHSIYGYFYEYEAVEAWNTRAQETCHDDSFSDVVELPTDATGSTIRPGARVMHYGKSWAVRTLMLTDEGEWLLDCQPEDGEPPAGRTVRPRDCKVLEERTLEDVLLEFLGAMADATEGDARDVEAAEDAAIRRYADEIRQILGVSS